MHKRLVAIVLVLCVVLLGYLFFQKTQKTPRTAALSSLDRYGIVSSYPTITAKDHIRGSKKALIILIEYGDYDCPYSKQFYSVVRQWMDSASAPTAWIYRHFPLEAHPFAMDKAIAAECAARQGGEDAFWEFTDRMFKESETNPEFFPCNEKLVKARVMRDITSGKKFRVGGTPMSFLINTQKHKAISIPGMVSLKQLIALTEKIK